MNFIKVKELFEIKKGKKVEQIEAFKEGCIRYIQIDDLRNNNNIKFCNEEKSYIISNSDDIIIAWDGANAGTIGYGLVGAIGSTLAILRKKDNNFNTEYCGLFLKSKFNYLRDKCTGATIPHISRSSLEELRVPNIGVEEQKKIANILNLAQELIDKRKKQIEELDLLVKSKFTEMFGDVFLNTKNFEMKQIKDIVTVVKGITYKPNQVNEEGTIVLRSSNIKGSKFDLNDIVRVNKKIDEKFLVEVNDILMCNRNGSERLVGKVAKIPEYNEPMTFGTFMTIIRSPYYNYLFTFFQTEAFRRQIKMQTSVAINQISIPLLESVKVPLPPIELQNQFADFVKQVDKLKFEMENSLKKLEDNFNSLMQKSFNGELV